MEAAFPCVRVRPHRRRSPLGSPTAIPRTLHRRSRTAARHARARVAARPRSRSARHTAARTRRPSSPELVLRLWLLRGGWLDKQHAVPGQHLPPQRCGDLALRRRSRFKRCKRCRDSRRKREPIGPVDRGDAVLRQPRHSIEHPLLGKHSFGFVECERTGHIRTKWNPRDELASEVRSSTRLRRLPATPARRRIGIVTIVLVLVKRNAPAARPHHGNQVVGILGRQVHAAEVYQHLLDRFAARRLGSVAHRSSSPFGCFRASPCGDAVAPRSSIAAMRSSKRT